MFSLRTQKIVKQNCSDENNSSNENSRKSDTDRQKLLSEAMQLGDVSKRRIFSFQDKAPPAPESHQNPLRVVYSIKTPMSTKSSSRYIPTSPERILDAPDFINDYCKSVRHVDSSNKYFSFFLLFHNSFPLQLLNRFKSTRLERFKYSNCCLRTSHLLVECGQWKY